MSRRGLVSAKRTTTSVNGIATGTTAGLTLQNTTAATVTDQVQRSPSSWQYGRAWDTDDAVSRSVGMGWQMRPVAGNTVSGGLTLMRDLAGVVADAGLTLASDGAAHWAHGLTLLRVTSSGGTVRELLTFGVDSTDDLSIGLNVANHDTRLRGDSLFLVAGASAIVLEWTGTALRKPNVTTIGASANVVFRAQGSTGGGAAGHGGVAIIEGGRRDGTAGSRMGGFRGQLNDNDTIQYTLLEGCHIDGQRRILAFNRGSALTATEMPTNTGDLVTFIGVASTAPTANPVSGFIVYVDPADNALKARSPAGTITTMGNP